jgi:hypothetical protein
MEHQNLIASMVGYATIEEMLCERNSPPKAYYMLFTICKPSHRRDHYSNYHHTTTLWKVRQLYAPIYSNRKATTVVIEITSMDVISITPSIVLK